MTVEERAKRAKEMLREILQCENPMGPPADEEERFYYYLRKINRCVNEKDDFARYNNFCIDVMHEISKTLYSRKHYYWIEHLEEHTKHCLQRTVE